MFILYLVMFLDFGYLYVDSYSGNLLRTNDGKLCIFDWGFVMLVFKDLLVVILCFIVYLVSKDFEVVLGDLDVMGFISFGKREAMEDLGVV